MREVRLVIDRNQSKSIAREILLGVAFLFAILEEIFGFISTVFSFISRALINAAGGARVVKGDYQMRKRGFDAATRESWNAPKFDQSGQYNRPLEAPVVKVNETKAMVRTRAQVLAENRRQLEPGYRGEPYVRRSAAPRLAATTAPAPAPRPTAYAPRPHRWDNDKDIPLSDIPF